MKYFIPFLFITLLLSQSCEKANLNNGIPSYINISSIEVDSTQIDVGSNSNKIVDAWVYFDNDLQGIYPLPAIFPVLLEGKKNISIKAGIKNNGIATTRVNYPFYDYYQQEVFLTKDSTTIIHPVVNYFDNTIFYIEDFELSGIKFTTTSNSDTILAQTTDSIFDGLKSGVAHLASPHLTFEVATEEIQLPKTGVPVYVELNYKCNTPFQVGVFANFPQTITTTSIVTINPTSEWNKIYIDLTSTVINTQQANSHKVFISMMRDSNSSETAELYIDNFKLLY